MRCSSSPRLRVARGQLLVAGADGRQVGDGVPAGEGAGAGLPLLRPVLESAGEGKMTSPTLRSITPSSPRRSSCIRRNPNPEIELLLTQCVNKAQNQNKQINHSVLSGTAGKSSEILPVAEGRLVLIVQEAACGGVCHVGALAYQEPSAHRHREPVCNEYAAQCDIMWPKVSHQCKF